MSTVGRRLLSSLIYEQDAQALMKMQLRPEFFRDNEIELYEMINDHLQSHGKLPHPDTIGLELGDVLVEVNEPSSFYLKGVEKRFLQTRLKTAVLDAQESLKAEDPDKAYTFLMETLNSLHMSRQRTDIIDYSQAADLIHTEYLKQHTAIEETGIFYGWPTIDKMTSGMRGGDFITVVGRPEAGKSFAILRTAHHEWRFQKGEPLVLSMEMGTLLMNQRLAAMDAHKPLTHILKGALSTKAYEHLISHLNDNKKIDRSLWIVDGNLAATAEDTLALVRKLKPTSLRVDGAYLLRSNNLRANRFERITENAEFLKQRIAGDMGIPVMASYQFKRGTTKKKKGDKSDGDDVYGSDAMLQLSSVMLGFLEEDSVETKKRRHVEILKGRSGETGGFDIWWNFMSMGFEEIEKEDVEDLQYLG